MTVDIRCKAKSPNEPGIVCNLPIGHWGPHEHISWDPADPSDVEVIDVWPTGRDD